MVLMFVCVENGRASSSKNKASVAFISYALSNATISENPRPRPLVLCLKPRMGKISNSAQTFFHARVKSLIALGLSASRVITNDGRVAV